LIKIYRMYAIVNIAGQQYKVEKDQKLFVHRLEDKEGDSVSFDEVLLIDNDKGILVGEPTIPGAMITGKVLSHPKGDKVQVFKKKKRKGYEVLRGHRQYLTEIQIKEILEKGAVKKPGTAAKAATKAPAGKAAAAKKEEAVKAAPAAQKEKTSTAKKPDTEKKTAAAKKPESAKKAPAAKTAASGKKAAPKKDTGSKPADEKSSGTAAKAKTKKPASGKTDQK
jgi:large subunit ribosomal protein L21